MNRHECYFDASRRPEMSCCAYCVIVDGQVEHSFVHHERIQSAYMAEMRALGLLLKHIQEQITPGSTVVVYGDALGLINKMNTTKTSRNRSKTNKTRKLLNSLRKKYDITLEHIPRRENIIAHSLSRTVYTPKPKRPPMRKRKGIPAEKILYKECKPMLLNDIVISKSMKKTVPHPEKYSQKLCYFKTHGQTQRPIQVNPNGLLLDGYISYLILQEHGITEINVEVLTLKSRREYMKERTRLMTIDDYAGVYQLWLDTTGVGLNNLDDSMEGIERYINRNPTTCFVYEGANAEIIGTILCGHDGRRGFIHHTAVKASERGKGVGTALVDAAVEALQKEGIAKAALVVFANNEPGNTFWENYGFTVREDLTYRNMILTV